MNAILKKRIKEAAEKIVCSAQCAYFDLDKTCNCYAKKFCIKTAEEILQNQWISVEEALPKDFEKVFFRAVGKNDTICFGIGYVANEDWYTDIQCGEQDYFKFEITHWMPIPELKGGGK